MFKNFIITLFVFTAIIADLKGQKTNDRSADETAIRANVQQMMNGWNAKSGEQFAKPFAEDADYIIINGGQIKGRAVIAKAHQQIFDTFYKNSNVTLAVSAIRFIKPDVAVVHAGGTLKITEGNSTRAEDAKMTIVMTKTGDKWEIVAFQNTQVQQQPRTN